MHSYDVHKPTTKPMELMGQGFRPKGVANIAI